MDEHARCTWVDSDGRCEETEQLVQRNTLFSAPRLLCPAHLHAAEDAAHRKRATASARP